MLKGKMRLRRVVGSSFSESPTMFIDGITNLVGYSQIKEFFVQIGKLGKVFVQRFWVENFASGSSNFFTSDARLGVDNGNNPNPDI